MNKKPELKAKQFVINIKHPCDYLGLGDWEAKVLPPFT